MTSRLEVGRALKAPMRKRDIEVPMTPEQARKAERTAVVEWLRKMNLAARKIFSDSDSEYFDGKSEAYDDAAKAIERGEHMKEPKL